MKQFHWHLQPQPILDTIREEEKYGNDGEGLGQVGRSFVGGVAKLTNFLSSTADVSIASGNYIMRAPRSLRTMDTHIQSDSKQ
jgi:hypothetical protein